MTVTVKPDSSKFLLIKLVLLQRNHRHLKKSFKKTQFFFLLARITALEISAGRAVEDLVACMIQGLEALEKFKRDYAEVLEKFKRENAEATMQKFS